MSKLEQILNGDYIVDNKDVIKEKLIMKKYIFRGENSGVFYGELKERNGQEVTIKNCRCLWYWSGACSLLELALSGVTCPDKCKFTVTVDELVILDCLELIECAEEAISIIEGVKAWKSKK